MPGGRSEIKVPSIFLALFNPACGREILKAGLRISSQMAGVIKLERSVDFEELSASIVRHPFTDKTLRRLHHGFEHGLARVIGHPVDMKPNDVAMTERRINAIGDPVAHLFLHRCGFVAVTS